VSAHSKPVRLAHAALLAGVDGKWQRATDLIKRINEECPGPGLGDALVAWCDAMQEHSTDGDMTFVKIQTAPMKVETGELEAHGEKAAYLAWCGRLITARAAGDRDAFVACMDELNAMPDGFERGQYVGALVESVALTIRTLPRGYARMGRAS
jgi:hypothetical protein